MTLVFFYGCGTFSHVLRKEHTLMVLEDRVLSRTFGSERDEVTGGWRKIHGEELCSLYSS
jgi:hypothetical protein